MALSVSFTSEDISGCGGFRAAAIITLLSGRCPFWGERNYYGSGARGDGLELFRCITSEMADQSEKGDTGHRNGGEGRCWLTHFRPWKGVESTG